MLTVFIWWQLKFNFRLEYTLKFISFSVKMPMCILFLAYAVVVICTANKKVTLFFEDIIVFGYR
jgi:hypothetical protein